jgi:hypothetical protein
LSSLPIIMRPSSLRQSPHADVIGGAGMGGTGDAYDRSSPTLATEASMRRFSGEPDLADVLTDPIVHALMRADGCDLRSLYESIDALREGDATASREFAEPNV